MKLEFTKAFNGETQVETLVMFTVTLDSVPEDKSFLDKFYLEDKQLKCILKEENKVILLYFYLFF